MISEPCVAAAAPVPSLADKVEAFLVVADLKAKEGLTVSEFGELFLALMRLCIEAVDSWEAAGDQKKELVLGALAELFDELADRAIPAYALPFWILARPVFRSALLALASGAIEVVLKLVRGQS